MCAMLRPAPQSGPLYSSHEAAKNAEKGFSTSPAYSFVARVSPSSVRYRLELLPYRQQGQHFSRITTYGSVRVRGTDAFSVQNRGALPRSAGSSPSLFLELSTTKRLTRTAELSIENSVLAMTRLCSPLPHTSRLSQRIEQRPAHAVNDAAVRLRWHSRNRTPTEAAPQSHRRPLSSRSTSSAAQSTTYCRTASLAINLSRSPVREGYHVRTCYGSTRPPMAHRGAGGSRLPSSCTASMQLPGTSDKSRHL